MTKKIGRNDPCPCGSGKKYKHCCLISESAGFGSDMASRALLQSSGLNVPKIKAYLEKHDGAPIMDYLIALQLNPQNHGKNLRIEHLSQLTVASLGKSQVAPNLKIFKSLVDEEYPMDVMEDLPTNMYTESVVFYGGNFVFFPGISTHVAELFRAMTEAVFYRNDIFPADFQRKVYFGVTLLLELGNLLADRTGIHGLIRGNECRNKKLVEPKSKQSFAISEETMVGLLNRFGIEKHILDSFVLNNNDPKLLTNIDDENPILFKPIVAYNDNYYFLGLFNQGCAINNFILKTAVKYNCLQELVQHTQLTVWMRIVSSCINSMRWCSTDYNDLLSSNSRCSEDLFQIDNNWLAYVCYTKDNETNVSVDGKNNQAQWSIESHLKETLSKLRHDPRTKGNHILTLVLYSTMGESFSVAIGKQPDTDYLLRFPAFDFLQLIQTEKWDNMSLVRYARTKELRQSLGSPFNEEVDIYSLYKHYGESFYVTDKTSPNFLYVEPNDGFHLIFESKEKLNFHGALFSLDGDYAYIPVQRDTDYGNIYKPIHPSIIAECCESYPVPVWSRCSQMEGKGVNPSSIIDTIITAIVFWMDALSPSLKELVRQHYTKTVEIDVQLSEDILFDKGLHTEIIPQEGSGTLTVTKNDKGVTVSLDHVFVKTFMGPDNGSERKMMWAIVKELFGLDDSTATTIIDERIPFGQAKMILMTEVSNNPIESPLWLYSPIYIHQATSQLLLDLFPKWMEDKGFVITKLEDKKQKEGFLHSGVDVLLEKLTVGVADFDIKALLKTLLNNHETLLHIREHNKVIHPAQIICFGDTPEKRNEFLATETRLTETGLATRVLIEYLAATQNQTGTKQHGGDDVEYLLAIASDVIRIGGICDAIHLDVADHNIEMLPSARYEINDEDFNDTLGSFASARSEESVNYQIEVFAKTMERLATHEPGKVVEKDEEQIKIDEAFEADWGVSYSDILQLLYACYVIAMNHKVSVMSIMEDDLVAEVKTVYPEMAEESIKNCISRLSLDKRYDYLTPPVGLDGKDIFPWVYNRELSYLRRPIVRYKELDGKVLCMFGFRSCLAAGFQLTDLLYSGRLKNGGKKMEKVLSQFQTKKGHVFNEEVRSFLSQISGLTVWPHDVTIKTNGNLKAATKNTDYGDIDVMAYHPVKNVLYSIECKNTTTAKNVREMKKEMDDYLGRGEGSDKDKALVLKHLRRHKWILENLEQVKKYIGITNNPRVKSMMLTATVIPTSYLKKNETPLSILNYPELRQKGLEYLDSCKEPIINIDNV